MFAPTNTAFAALLSELGVSKEALLANKALLTKVLTYEAKVQAKSREILANGLKPHSPTLI